MSAFKSMPIGTRVTELDVRSFSNIGTSDISARYPTNSLTEQYGTVRQHLLLSLHELDKLYNETVHSLNVFSQHFNSEALVIQHQIQADHHVRRVFCAKTDVTREDLSHVDESVSTTVTSVGDQHERSYANIVSRDISRDVVMSSGKLHVG